MNGQIHILDREGKELILSTLDKKPFKTTQQIKDDVGVKSSLIQYHFQRLPQDGFVSVEKVIYSPKGLNISLISKKGG